VRGEKQRCGANKSKKKRKKLKFNEKRGKPLVWHARGNAVGVWGAWGGGGKKGGGGGGGGKKKPLPEAKNSWCGGGAKRATGRRGEKKKNETLKKKKNTKPQATDGGPFPRIQTANGPTLPRGPKESRTALNPKKRSPLPQNHPTLGRYSAVFFSLHFDKIHEKGGKKGPLGQQRGEKEERKKATTILGGGC